MKSETRKRTVRHKPGAQAEDPVATDVSTGLADAAYAAQLLAAAENLAAQPGAVAGDTDETQPINGSASEMSKSTSRDKTGNVTADAVVLPAQCLLRDAVDLRVQLLPRVDAPEAVRIDVSKVERIDAATMQVLLAFVRDRAQHHHEVEWLGMNAAMMDAATSLGVASLLKLPVTGAAA
jgi:ABC-type transporter Mla MlaB component